jgi:putative transposase
VLVVKKTTGEFWMCVDYGALNKVTIPNKYPLPRIDDLLERVKGAKVFSSLDLLPAYHQIRLVDDSFVKTALKTPFGLFEYKVMPVGLTKTPSVFMAVMNDVLQGPKFVSVYLHDILIFSKTPEEHIKHIATVVDKIMSNNL